MFSRRKINYCRLALAQIAFLPMVGVSCKCWRITMIHLVCLVVAILAGRRSAKVAGELDSRSLSWPSLPNPRPWLSYVVQSAVIGDRRPRSVGEDSRRNEKSAGKDAMVSGAMNPTMAAGQSTQSIAILDGPFVRLWLFDVSNKFHEMQLFHSDDFVKMW